MTGNERDVQTQERADRTLNDDRARGVAVITGGSQGIGARLVDGYRRRPSPPGIIQTPVHPAESYAALGDRLPPLGRVGQVSDIVGAVLYLESAPYVTRQDPACRRRPNRGRLTRVHTTTREPGS